MPIRRALALLLLAGLGTGGLHAQDAKEAEKKLQQLRGELKSVAAERRKIEGQRGDASRQLRQADEQVGRSSRSLAQTESLLKRERSALDELQQQRDALQARLATQRRQMAALMRAAYLQGDNAPLKALLSQDSVARANLALTYQGYVQRDRARQVAQLNQELEQLAQLQAQVDERRTQLEQARQQQHSQVSQLEKDRQQRATLVAELDKQYRSRAEREKALGQDAKALERLLANLRAAARRAEQERKRQEAAAAASTSPGAPKKTPPKVSASAPPLRVGGAGWPASGNLLARYGGRMPDGRNSSGLLIGAAAGSPVSAVADGTVVFAEWMTGYGLILIVDHGNGYMSLYAHNESLLHDAGDTVKRGEAVAKVGSSGGFGTPALYFELRRDGQPVDPSAWLQKR